MTDEYEQVLAQAVQVLTAAARLTHPAFVRDEEATQSTGKPVWIPSKDERQPIDWADFVAHALAAAAANVGGIGRLLRGRPGSWEADYLRQLLGGTVGHDEEYLLEHRTEPITINVDLDGLLYDAGVEQAYEAAGREIERRYNAAGIPTVMWPEEPPPLSAEQQTLVDDLIALEERLEEQFQQDRAAYAAALTAAIEAAVNARTDIRVPVHVVFNGPESSTDDLWDGIESQLLRTAVESVSLPGGGRTPLERIEEAPASSEEP